MSAAAPDTVGEVEVFRHQARTTHQIVRLNAAGLTHEESLIQPHPGGNCLNWVVGHLVCIHHVMLEMLGQEPVMERSGLERYNRGSAPLRDPSEALDLGMLLEVWDEAAERLDAGLAALTPEALDGPAPHSPGGDPGETLRTLLCFVVFHQAYHAGQLGLLRRIAGKEGAIP
jgi:uncharacterized damage-inducible protein DinB